MVSIGDIKNNLRILQSEARQMKYQGEFELEGLVKGNPQSLLPLYNYLFTNYCSEFTVEVMNLLSDGLSMKADVRFMESVYKICRDMFGYKPPMTKEQFFTANSFAERKVIMCFEVMRLVKERCRYLGPRNPTNPNIKVQSVVDTGRHSKRTSECELVTSEPSGRRTAESGHTRISDMLAKSHDHSSDWDPSEAVECILSKVRDLPAQLTNFMKAVEGRLQKIEERLDLVEVKAVHVNYTEGSNAVPGKWKQDLDTVQSRLLLLENRVMLCENRSAPRTASSDHPKLVGDKTTELSAASPFVSLERGGDSFSGSMLHNFSPIRKGDGDVNQYSNNDTITSVADVEKRLSSTPNMSGNTLSLVPTGGGRQGREAAWRKGDAATGADGDGGDVTAPCENLDTSTLQQVERIKSLFKTTQRLLPTGSQSSRDS
ncbi:centrosomal protein of 44 kDa-like isoform X4 [Littorina saxatilis]|uniref:Centrosomal protein of 44 kDa n=1 Tax=Littorina saxatilis TaxID=31220 RepID=A0AAN9B3K7_9CAEN